ncbi:hypothetical protein L0665_07315 [Methanogenium marinum]|uniref:Chaperone DnaJ C-terminal domain-containing protein n=1 Tax=Methanogenium marinum TaxID=348610 RepID=A0A9Q4KQF4_9EURY|nr:hypothetical protein [Methanogenium marinum]MDE4908420.1 hypothetical protein [Methanogenium marinum]
MERMTEGLDREYAIWVNRDELGEKKEIHLEGKRITFKIPEQIEGHAVLRLKGLGFRNGSKKGDLFVRISLMEEDRGSEGSPFYSKWHGSSFGGGSGPLPWMNRSQVREEGGEQNHCITPNKAVKDPMQMRRAGYLISGAGLVLIAGGIFGILPISAWIGISLVVLGVYLVSFA